MNEGDTIPEGAPVLQRIGPYRVMRLLGQGGMGDVFLAERTTPVRQLVALKVVKRGMDTSTMLKRFASERQVLALMEHHNIAKLYDVGATDDGLPYFAMEYVKGHPITQYCDESRLGLKDRIELFRHVCAGVQHAHQKGIMHRDLKPSNVLVAIEDDVPVPKIIDFGLARATDHARLQQSTFTEYGALVGTLEYMAPEQADVGELDIDTRTDIYSLGVMLYELLVGSLPFSGEELRRAGLMELRRIIREVEPPRPSVRLSRLKESGSAVATLRRTNPTTLLRLLRTDLDRVVLKAMAKERQLRYATPSELAEDLRRFIDNEPVLAADPSTLYRLRKFARRYRVQCVATGMVFLALVGGAIGTWSGYRDAVGATRTAEETARQLAGANRFLGFVARRRELLSRAPLLHPAWPHNLPGMRGWMAEADELLAAKPDIVLARAALQRAASAGSPTGSDDALLLRSLILLENDLEELRADGGPMEVVRSDLAWAASVEARSILDHRDRWRDARTAILAADGVRAHEAYGGFDLRPQMGLVPLGLNPTTRLWEFYHLRSAAPDAPIPFDSALGAGGPPDPDWGIIFVLIPGGERWIGAQKRSREEPNFDERVDERDHQLPLQRVAIRPFFLARYETTKLQWVRLSTAQTGGPGARPQNPRYGDPSYNRIDDVMPGGRIVSAINPVEWVSWEMTTPLLARHGLILPDERQWEFACRAGTGTPWFTGERPESLSGFGNFADTSYRAGGGGSHGGVYFDDGHYGHAPVGSFAPNPWGLYDMLGNVFELTSDVFNDGGAVVIRGGSWLWPPDDSRCAFRGGLGSAVRAQNTGFRAARAVR